MQVDIPGPLRRIQPSRALVAKRPSGEEFGKHTHPNVPPSIDHRGEQPTQATRFLLVWLTGDLLVQHPDEILERIVRGPDSGGSKPTLSELEVDDRGRPGCECDQPPDVARILQSIQSHSHLIRVKPGRLSNVV